MRWLMAVQNGPDPVLAICHVPNSPEQPTCYGSPAKSLSKRQVSKVGIVSSTEALRIRLEEVRNGKLSTREEKEGSDGGEEIVKTTRKSQYWTKEVEDRVGMGGVDPYGLLELDHKRYKATADEIRKAYRRLVLTHHPDKKAAEKAAGNSPSPKRASKADSETVPELVDREEDDDEAEGEDEEDAEFKLLSQAWEMLGNEEKRRSFDSVDYFNDSLPESKPKTPDLFYKKFGPAFDRQAKFSTVQPCPKLGDAETPYEEVAEFYRHWNNYTSWRDFTLLCEHDPSAAEVCFVLSSLSHQPHPFHPLLRCVLFFHQPDSSHMPQARSIRCRGVYYSHQAFFVFSHQAPFFLPHMSHLPFLPIHTSGILVISLQEREERRWMQRQNKNESARHKKSEMGRVQAFIQLAYENDPRILKHREAMAAAKEAARLAKQEARAAEEKKKNAHVEAAAEAAKAKEAEQQLEKAKLAEERKVEKAAKEKARSALKKVRKEFKALGELAQFADKVNDLEVIAAALSMEELVSLKETLATAGEAADGLLGEALAKAMAQ